MGSSSLFIISTLALLGAAASQTCSTESLGVPSLYAINFQDVETLQGATTLIFKNPCPKKQVGILVTACSAANKPSIKMLDLEHATIGTLSMAKVTSTAYCDNQFGFSNHAASLRGIHRPGNYYVDVAPANPFLAGNVARNFFVDQG